jgi:hypothetical protein
MRSFGRLLAALSFAMALRFTRSESDDDDDDRVSHCHGKLAVSGQQHGDAGYQYMGAYHAMPPEPAFFGAQKANASTRKVYQLVQPEFAHDGHWRAKFIKHKFYLYFNREVR